MEYRWGRLRPNSSHVDFAIWTIEFFLLGEGCLCGLYLIHDLYDPKSESKAGNVQITD
jgi:hypothetical protein